MCLEVAERLRSPKPIKRKIEYIVSCCRSVDEKVKGASHWGMASKMHEGGPPKSRLFLEPSCKGRQQ
jgi:hypothetical protein